MADSKVTRDDVITRLNEKSRVLYEMGLEQRLSKRVRDRAYCIGKSVFADSQILRALRDAEDHQLETKIDEIKEIILRWEKPTAET